MTDLVSIQDDNTPYNAERKEPTIVDATILPWPTSADESGGQSDRYDRQCAEIRLPKTTHLGDRSTRQSVQDTFVSGHTSMTYSDVFDYVMSERESDRACLNIVKKAVFRVLENNGISAQVTSRIKSIYGTYMKMQVNECTVREVMDRIGIRIIVRNVPECYQILGLLHMHFKPIPGTFDDYIANPKANGYQSLHTCVYALKQISRKPIEFQVRTWLMHRNAEIGNASHQRYKIGNKMQIDLSEYFSDGDNLVTVQGRQTGIEPFIEEFTEALLDNSVVTFTAAGRKVHVPEGTTLGDYINLLGGQVSGKTVINVNGQPQTSDYRLHDGDTVEMTTRSKSAVGAEPSVDELTLL